MVVVVVVVCCDDDDEKMEESSCAAVVLGLVTSMIHRRPLSGCNILKHRNNSAHTHCGHRKEWAKERNHQCLERRNAN